jgi:hypothetical protein
MRLQVDPAATGRREKNGTRKVGPAEHGFDGLRGPVRHESEQCAIHLDTVGIRTIPMAHARSGDRLIS